MWPSRGHLATSGGIFGRRDQVAEWGQEGLLASSELESRDSTKYTGQFPQQRIIQAQMSTVPQLKNPELQNAVSPNGKLIKLYEPTAWGFMLYDPMGLQSQDSNGMPLQLCMMQNTPAFLNITEYGTEIPL